MGPPLALCNAPPYPSPGDPGAPRRAALSLAQRVFWFFLLTVPELKGVVRVFWLLLRELDFLEKSEVDGDLRSDSN